MTRTQLLALLVLCGCVHRATLDQELSHVPITNPLPPLTLTDTVLLVALRHALLEGIPDFSPRTRVIVQADPMVSARVLPGTDSTRFFILDHDRIQQLANRSQDFTFLILSKPAIRGDTAQVQIQSAWAYQRRGFRSGMGGGACIWLFTRESGGWVRSKVIRCVVS